MAARLSLPLTVDRLVAVLDEFRPTLMLCKHSLDSIDEPVMAACRAHDVENLWVIDGGFFPSSAAMNPALTIAAQALRAVAESALAT